MKIKLNSYKLLFRLLDILSDSKWLHKLVVNKKVYLGATIISLSMANNSCSENKTKDTLKDDKSNGETTTCYEIVAPASGDDDNYINEISSMEETDSSIRLANKKHKGLLSPKSKKRENSIVYVTSCYINLEIDNVEAESAAPTETDSTIYTITDEDAEFAGGMDSLNLYISRNIKYFPSSCYVSIEGTVYVKFVVTKTGELADIKVIRSLGVMQDEEAIRLVKNMPKWIPARHQGKTVNTYYILPIRFNLQ